MSDCSGQCLTDSDIGVPSSEIAYPHPDCPEHGNDWAPYDNEWSRRYVAEHPERFEHRYESTLDESERTGH